MKCLFRYPIFVPSTALAISPTQLLSHQAIPEEEYFAKRVKRDLGKVGCRSPWDFQGAGPSPAVSSKDPSVKPAACFWLWGGAGGNHLSTSPRELGSRRVNATSLGRFGWSASQETWPQGPPGTLEGGCPAAAVGFSGVCSASWVWIAALMRGMFQRCFSEPGVWGVGDGCSLPLLFPCSSHKYLQLITLCKLPSDPPVRHWMCLAVFDFKWITAA